MKFTICEIGNCRSTSSLQYVAGLPTPMLAVYVVTSFVASTEELPRACRALIRARSAAAMFFAPYEFILTASLRVAVLDAVR
jgi:hypothetical protein